MNELTLTLDQKIKLEMYIKLTTQYREKERKACEELGKELDENGNVRFLNMKSNAQWWQECNETLIDILNKLYSL